MRPSIAKIFALLVLTVACVASVGAAQNRVACVGDSITKGAGADKGQDYPTQLARMLGGEYAVSNFGVSTVTLQKSGNRPYWNHKLFKAATASRPNIVVLMLGTNDAKPENFKDKEAFLADMRAMVDTLAGLPTKPKVVLCLPPPVLDDGYGISTKILKEDITPLIEQVAKEKKLTLIDCYTPFAGKPGLTPDGVHPNAEGNVLLAKTIAAAIKGEQPKPADDKTATQQAAAQFPGEKKQWNGFDQYNFEVDGRKCFVTVPKEAAAGKPWILRGLFSDSPADADLVGKGFHIAYIDIVALHGSPKALAHWDAFYREMTEKYGLAKKVALMGISRGSLPAHKWASANPDKVACIVGIAPVCDIKSWPGGKGLSGGHGASWKQLLEAYGMTEQQAMEYKQNPIDVLEPIAKAEIPVLHIYSPQDEGVPYEENSKVVAERLKELGGDFTGIAIEVPRSSVENDPLLKSKQAAVDKKNPKALAGAHRKVCDTADKAAITAFILKNAAGK